jgi:hypothetical protein
VLCAWVATGTGCSGGLKSLTKSESVQNYVHPRPMDQTLNAAAKELESQGFKVRQDEDSIGTNFIRTKNSGRTAWCADAAECMSPVGPGESREMAGVVVFGERVDANHSKIITERVVLSWQPLRNPSEERRKDLEVFEDGSRAFLRLKRSSESGQWKDMMLSMGFKEGQVDLRDIPRGGDIKGESAPADQPTTLSNLPKGMSVLRRERDDELEWTLIKQSDAIMARAVEREDARARNAPPPVVDPPPTAAMRTAMGSCGEAISGVDVLAENRRLVLLGDFPGTNEIPDLVGRLVCQLLEAGTPVSVGLELVQSDQPALDAYLKSDGSDEARVALLAASKSFKRSWQDGRTSAAVARLIERLRVLHAAGLPVTAFAIDTSGASGNLRNAYMARAIEYARRAAADSATVVMIGNLRARVTEGLGDDKNYEPAGYFLARWGLRPLALRVRFEDGTAWYCPPDPIPKCGPYAVNSPKTLARIDNSDDATRWVISQGMTPWEGAGGHTAPTGKVFPGTVVFWGEDATNGFNGEYFVGPLTASPPAIEP